ncbi:MAG: DUF1730 domain-containing protein [Oscillospiraceae bacterium]|nr:DUF1730 domain-containing protein [Oscillospiraceae bacterium]
MEKLLFSQQIYHFGVVSFQHLNILNVRSKSRIPPDCTAAIAIIFPYYNKNAFMGNISAYCSVPDYHIVVMEQLKSICEKLSEKYPGHSFVPFVDSSPVDEVDMAVKAGLGVKGDNGLLITPTFGSYVFIGEILTTLPLASTCHADRGCLHCGRCATACPGGAIAEGRVNTETCASHISQKKGELTEKETDILSRAHTVFGCDICQTVCPMNRNVKETENLFSQDIISTITTENVESLYKNRPFGWRGLPVLKRNLEIYYNGR